jgi:hypothetical protein
MRRATTTHRTGSAPRADARRSHQGQSLVEFALVIPILLVVFVAVADFGRVFVAGVTLDSATRDAAEAAANRYVATPPGPLDAPAPGIDQAYYGTLHTYAASVVCSEMRGLPGTNYLAGSPPSCPDMPVVVVCVHDGADLACDSQASPGSAGIPATCGDFSPGPTNAQVTNPDGTQSRWVEVRTCYHFTPLLDLPLFSLGDVWLQRTRNFTIPCWFVLAGAECG